MGVNIPFFVVAALINAVDLDIVFQFEFVDLLCYCFFEGGGDLVGDLFDSLQQHFLPVFDHQSLELRLAQFLHSVVGEEAERIPQGVGVVPDRE